MQVAVIGAGHVGLVTGLTLAILGHRVVGFDVDAEKIAGLQAGEPPFFEPGLEQALVEQLATRRLAFTSHREEAVAGAQVIVLCLPTPGDASGAADLSFLLAEVERLAPLLAPGTVLVVKSTVPVGTNALLSRRLADWADGAGGSPEGVAVVSNPEFLREGTALRDSLEPDRIVVGARSPWAFAQMETLYRGMTAPWVRTTPEEAEMIKYASNAFLALKISFANALADFCEAWGADIRRVTAGMGLDPRVGPHFLRAGLGFGGSCLPKDVRALLWQWKACGLDATLLAETLRINEGRIPHAVAKLRGALGTLAGRTVALWGLAFKAHTDDIRESPALRLAEALLREGCRVQAYDPQAMEAARRVLPQLTYTLHPVEAARGADALVLATEWPEFAEAPWAEVLQVMAGRVVLDARGQLDGEALAHLGAYYLGLGIPPQRPAGGRELARSLEGERGP